MQDARRSADRTAQRHAEDGEIRGQESEEGQHVGHQDRRRPQGARLCPAEESRRDDQEERPEGVWHGEEVGPEGVWDGEEVGPEGDRDGEEVGTQGGRHHEEDREEGSRHSEEDGSEGDQALRSRL